MLMKKDLSIAFFDFDGTITSKESFSRFILFTQSKTRLISYFILLLPKILLYYLKIISDETLKQKVLFYFFKGYSIKQIEKWSHVFQKNIHKWTKKESVLRINWHLKKGHKVCVVSASPDFYLEQWCKNLNIDLICTEVKYESNTCNGHFKFPNCKGEEKVRRINLKYDLDQYETIYAYGDSKADKPMLSLAHYQYYRYFIQ